MASVTIVVPDAAVPLVKAVLVADGWDQITPPTFSEAFQQHVLRYYKTRITEQKSSDASAAIQIAIAQAVAEASAALGL